MKNNQSQDNNRVKDENLPQQSYVNPNKQIIRKNNT
jgi:hypothetical protein